MDLIHSVLMTKHNLRNKGEMSLGTLFPSESLVLLFPSLSEVSQLM